MPSKFSLTKKRDFDQLFTRGMRKSNSLFGSTYLQNQPSFKVAIITQKKVMSHAVSRNYSRRVVRSILRGVNLPTDIYLAIIVKKDLGDFDFEEIKVALRELIPTSNEIKK